MGGLLSGGGELIIGSLRYTAILRKVDGINVPATIPKVIWDMINTLFLTL